MILLRVFFDFKVEVLEVLEGFEPWFLQSFFTFESWSLSSPSSALLQPSTNYLGRLQFIGVWGWVNDTWQSLIGNTCHNLIGLLMSSLTHAGLLVSSLTHARLLVTSLTRARLLVSSLIRALMRDWFLHDTWQISVGFWVVIAKSSSSMWHFVICCILWTW